jgi:hypothetical protein
VLLTFWAIKTFNGKKKYRYYCQVLIKLEFSRDVLEKYLDTKFHKNPSRGSRVLPCGQKDRNDEGNCEKRLKWMDSSTERHMK